MDWDRRGVERLSLSIKVVLIFLIFERKFLFFNSVFPIFLFF